MLSIDRLLYKLKRRYGKLIDFYTESDNTNLLTGTISKTIKKYTIRHGVILTQRNSFMNFINIKANPIIEDSGLLNLTNTELLLDGNDFPKDLVLELIDYVIINHERYEIKNILKVDDKQSYLLILKEYKGSRLYEVHTQCIHDKLTMVHKCLM